MLRSVAIVCIAAVGSVALAPIEARGEEPAPPPMRYDMSMGLKQVPLKGDLALTLNDAIAIGLVNNLNVEVERYAPLIQELDADAAWGSYDPEIFANYGYASIEEPTASSLQAGNSVRFFENSGEGGVRGALPWLGATYDVTVSGERSSTNQSIRSLSPELTSSLTLSGSIPLLRGLIWNEAWTNVKSSKADYEGTEYAFVTRVMDSVRRISDGYWGLVAAREQVGVARSALETAHALLEQSNTQYEVGVVSRVDVVEAEAGVAEREFDLIVAENAYGTSQDLLMDVVLGPYLTATSQLQLVAVDDPEEYIRYEIDLQQAADLAFAKRPELRVAEKLIEINEIQLKFAKNQRLPQLDAQLSYGFKGLAGDQNPDAAVFGTPQPITVGNDYGDTYDDYFKGDGADTFTARAFFSIPFPNTTARKRVSIGELELRRSNTRLRRLRQDIILEIRVSARDVESAILGIEAAERRRLASEEQLRSERIRLEHGESTPFDVLQRVTDYTDAESEKIRALQVYRTSVAALDRAQGTILENSNVNLQQVRNQKLSEY